MNPYYITVRVYGPNKTYFLADEEYLTSYAERETLADAIDWTNSQMAHYESQGYSTTARIYHNGEEIYSR